MLGRDGGHASGGSLDPPGLELGLADHVEQVVHPPGWHAHGLAPAALRLRGLDDVLDVDLDHRRGELGDLDRVGAVERLVERDHQGREVVGGDGAVGAGHGPADALGGCEQQVHQVTAYGEAAVT